ncbi:ester cyclase [Nocardia sp. GCM10030253]|uniref:ester cyclase n=1 Tax=Nocardia sp. GCM10030253 TaxID=3273404 RepID=UPI00363F909E
MDRLATRPQPCDKEERQVMNRTNLGEAAKAVVRRNTEQVQGQGNFTLFEELFADDFIDHTPQPNTTPDKDGVRVLYQRLREAFPDFRPEIHWQTVEDDVVTTYKTYHGTHLGSLFGIAPTGRVVQFETVDAMRVRDGRIVEHWGVADLFSLVHQLGARLQA